MDYINNMNGHSQITIELPEPEIIFAEQYAQEHGMNVNELFDMLIKNLSLASKYPINEKVRSMIGILPPDTDIDSVRMAYLTEKYLRNDRHN